jgi:PTH1 family peptidyl-tRNA hydrolase
LGNPGARYAATRHNVGFMVVDQLGAAGPWVERFKGQFCLWSHGSERVGLLKPQTFMNLSGQSVRAALDFYKIDKSRLLVVCDELDVPFNQLRLKFGGGEAGHNGVRSISEQLGSRDFHRLRVGIGRPPADFKGSGADFVLQAFAAAEAAELPQFLERCTAAVKLFIERGPEVAMNETNRKR